MIFFTMCHKVRPIILVDLQMTGVNVRLKPFIAPG